MEESDNTNSSETTPKSPTSAAGSQLQTGRTAQSNTSTQRTIDEGKVDIEVMEQQEEKQNEEENKENGENEENDENDENNEEEEYSEEEDTPQSSINSSRSDESDTNSVESETIEEVGEKIPNVESSIIGAFQSQHRLLESILGQIKKNNQRLDKMEKRVNQLENNLPDYITTIVFDILNGKRISSKPVSSFGGDEEEEEVEGGGEDGNGGKSDDKANKQSKPGTSKSKKSSRGGTGEKSSRSKKGGGGENGENDGGNDTPSHGKGKKGLPPRPESPNFDYKQWNHRKQSRFGPNGEEIQDFGKTLTDISKALYTLKDRVDVLENGGKKVFTGRRKSKSNGSKPGSPSRRGTSAGTDGVDGVDGKNKDGSTSTSKPGTASGSKPGTAGGSGKPGENGTAGGEEGEEEDEEDILARINQRLEDLERKLNEGWLSINTKQVIVTQNQNLGDFICELNMQLKNLENNQKLTNQALDGKADKSLAVKAVKTAEAIKTKFDEYYATPDPTEEDPNPQCKFDKMLSDLRMLIETNRANIQINKDEIEKIKLQIIEIMDDLINFDRIDNVDNKIEKKFNKLMLELQTAVKAINRDEDEIRKATTKMKSSLSSLQRSVSKPNTSRSQVDEHLAEQVAILSEHISKKMDKDEAMEYLTNKTDREELQRIITQLSMDLRRSLNQTIEKALPAEDSNPWATKGVESPTSEMYCLSCNRKRTMDKEKKPISTLGPGYQSLGGGFQVRLPEIRNKKVPQYDLLSSDDDEGSDASPLVGTDGKIYRGRSLDPGEFSRSIESNNP